MNTINSQSQDKETNLKLTKRVFVGSSSEALPIAELVNEKLKSEKFKKLTEELNIILIPILWKDRITNQTMNEYFLESFDLILKECEFAIFIMTADDTLIKREDMKGVTRDNVWFEAGMFIGKRGRGKTYFLVSAEDWKNNHSPTDMLGLNMLPILWDPKIVKQYCNPDDESFKKYPGMKNAVKSEIEKQIEIYCNSIAKKIKEEITNENPIEKSEATIIKDTVKCFDVGIGLVKSAKTKLYTSISFSGSLTPQSYEEELKCEQMYKELCNKITTSKEIKELEFKRYMKLPKSEDKTKDENKIQQEYNNLEIVIKEAHKDKSASLIPITFDCLEIIVSDNDVCLAFPDYRGKKNYDRVAFCIHIKDNEEFANIISAWLSKKLKDCENNSSDQKSETCLDCKISTKVENE